MFVGSEGDRPQREKREKATSSTQTGEPGGSGPSKGQKALEKEGETEEKKHSPQPSTSQEKPDEKSPPRKVFRIDGEICFGRFVANKAVAGEKEGKVS